MKERPRWVEAAGAAIVALLAFGIYLATLSRGACPGPSAVFLTQALESFPRVSPGHPVWWTWVGLVRRLPWGDVILRLNVLSAVCGALAVGATYGLAKHMVEEWIVVDETNRFRSRVAAHLAGIGSAVALAFCVPFWVVANRFHPASFHLLLLIVLSRLVLAYLRSGQWSLLFVTALLYGVGIVEWATLIVWAPFFAFLGLYGLLRHDQFQVGRMILLVLAGLVGLSLYGWAAWAFYGSEGYAIRGYRSLGNVVFHTWRDQALLILSSLPRVGFLNVLLLTAVPWLTSLIVARRALNEEKNWGFYLLHALLTVLVGMVLSNIPIAPWPQLGMRLLLVTPYFLVALLAGYLLAYWFLLPSVWWTHEEEDPIRRRTIARAVLTTLLLGLLFLLPFRNARQADAREAQTVTELAHDIVRTLPPSVHWLITDGALDPHIRLAATRQGRVLHPIHFRASEDPLMVRYLSRCLPAPRLKNLLAVGVGPLVQEWLHTDPDAHQKIALQVVPDFWTEAGFTEVPSRMVFLGTTSTNRIDASSLLAEHEAFWDRWLPRLRQPDSRSPLHGLFSYLRRQMSLVANNLGVFLEDRNRPEDAFRVYARARELDPHNVSALLNQWVLIGKGIGLDRKEKIQEQIARLPQERQRQYDIRQLAAVYGYVRTPEAFARLGWTWALSGRPGMAISGLKRALGMLTEGEKGEWRELLAGLYLQREQNEKSEALYHALLTENPTNRSALLGLARLAARQGDVQRAVEYLTRAEDAGADKMIVAMEWAILHLMGGDLEQARVAAQEIVARKPDLLPAWALLVELLVRQRDDAGLQRCIQQLTEVRGAETIAGAARAHLALLQNDLEEARARFAALHARMPQSPHFLSCLLRLDMVQNRRVEAEQHARRLLAMVPDHAFANYVMGTLQFERGDLALAEDSFRRSLRKQRSLEALNDLAWLLTQRQEYREAETLAREVLRRDETLSAAWDTLAFVLMKTGRMEEAENAFDRCRNAGKPTPQILLHLAEFELRKGNPQRALHILEELDESEPHLSASDRVVLQNLRQEARSLRES